MSMNFGKLNFAVGFNRTSAFPIDANGYFEDLEKAKAAALTAADVGSSDSAYYFGQLIAVVLDKVADIYVITKGKDGKGSLQEVGSATLGDDHTIDLDVDTKQLSLHDFGKFYYAFSTDESGNTHYTKTAITEANKAKLAGLEARIVLDGDKYVLGWYEPNTTTVEGVSKELASLKTTVQGQGNILTGDATVEGSVNKRIADAVAAITQIKYQKVEGELPESGVAGTIYLKPHNDHYKEFLWLDNKWEEIGDLDDVDLTNYYNKTQVDNAIDADVLVETNRATGAEEALSGRIKTLEDVGAQANVIENIGVKTEAEGKYTNVTISGKQAQLDLSGYATKTALEGQKTTIDGEISAAKTELEGKISTAQTTAESNANSYTDTAVGGVNTELGKVKTSIGTVPEGSTVIGEIEKKVSTSEFGTFKTSNTEAIATAKSEAITAAGANADTKISKATGELGTKEVDGAQVAKTVKEYVDEKVAAAAPTDYDTVKAQVETNKSAISAINDASTGILAQAKADATTKANAVLGSKEKDTEASETVYGAIAAAKAAKTSADAKVAAVEAADKSVVVATDAATKTAKVNVKISEVEGNLLKLDTDGLKVVHKDAPKYSIKKLEAAETGFAATYKLLEGETEVGASINIPKDYIVKSAELKICADKNDPQVGFAVGDKYIDFTINTKDGEAGTTGESHIYLNVKDLVDVYTSGTGIDVSKDNKISVKVVANNGLSVDTDGIKLGTAGKDADAETYHAGAMSAAAAEKLAGVEAGAQANVLDGVLDGEGEALTITGKKVQLPMATATKLGLVKGVEASTANANKVSVAADGTMSVGYINASSIYSDKAIRINGGNASSDFSNI